MNTLLYATFDGEILRPEQPVRLPPNTRVRITLETVEPEIPTPLSFLIEDYSPERKAEFLLNNAIDTEDYQAACAAVLEMGLNPDTIPHERPT